MNIQPILNIAEICSRKGINNAIISPGSRSAPITLGFANHDKIKSRIVNDERSAGFIALGMALQLEEPVVLICTSGTAVLNYAPAIAEANYQQIPLIVLTADRPPELIDQQDGQCLRQFEIFKNYIKSSYQTPDDLENRDNQNKVYQIIDEAVTNSVTDCKGPVHVNIPLREPFYPTSKVKYDNFDYVKDIGRKELSSHSGFSYHVSQINQSKKVLFIAGQQQKNLELSKLIQQLIDKNYPVITDINSNLSELDNSIDNEEIIFQKDLGTHLHPEFVITFGNSILSKKLKLYFRNNKIKHLHLAETIPIPDFFFQLNDSFQFKPIEFFKLTIDHIKDGNQDFFENWQNINKSIQAKKTALLTKFDWSEPHIINKIVYSLPTESNLHLSNSMTVRWFNYIGINKKFTIQSNRGVSGIDGCTSTALGFAINSKKQNYLFTGDIAFFYDRNAFWNDFIPNNLKIVLFNNHEGGIFNMIPGPNNEPQYLEYFTSTQKLTAKSLSEEYSLDYFLCKNSNELDNELEPFINSPNCAVLEVGTDSSTNKILLDKLKCLAN